jgi:hypothetical protein
LLSFVVENIIDYQYVGYLNSPLYKVDESNVYYHSSRVIFRFFNQTLYNSCVSFVFLYFFSFHFRHNREKKPLLKSGTTIKYNTALTIPYAHVIRDDNFQVESSNVDEANAPDTLLFNGTMPDRTSQTRMY